MKNKLFISLGTFLLLILGSCKKEIGKIYYQGGTSPNLTSSKVGTIPLSFANSTQEAIRLTWTNPDYAFTTGLSSQDVSYLIEIDTTGANFTNPKRQQISISKDLTKSFTVAEFNDILLNQLQLDSLSTHALDIRVRSTIAGTVPLYSNVLKFTGVKPYAIPPKIPPPASGKLYITGSATPASWMVAGDPELANQKFNKVNNFVYVLPSIALTGGNSYLFVPVYGDWGAKYGGVGDNNTNNVNGDDFKPAGGDLKAPAASGNYKIEVDFQRGKFTVTKL